MFTVQKALFPGIAFGCIFVVFVTSLIASPNVALASNPPVAPAVVSAAPTPAVEQPAPSVENTVAQEAVDQAATPGETVQEAGAETTDCSISRSFPDTIQQWCGLIDRYAGEYGVDPNLVASVMLQESAGNPNAYSKSGAVGLMQVMPRDGLAASFMCINGPCFASRPTMEQLYDPEFNISYGVRMLAGLIEKRGSVREALRAYGPMDMGYRYADIVLNILERYQ